ncbi:BON domain-containing protein [Roseateles sp. DB2]|uniref:BON domain-containing protein n=1 Tax=Roseateles sp. DB2 TaxID=3453717 RepID=UPI003EE9B73E
MKTNSQLQQDVDAELRWDPSTRAARISAQAEDGVVTLSGVVEGHAQKWQALRAAQRVAGVQSVICTLAVHLQSASQRTDRDIADAAVHRLAWHAALTDARIAVAVENAWVYLTGHVPWHYQRRAAVECVGGLLGVAGVHDHIRLKQDRAPRVAKSDICDALVRAAGVDARSILVQVDGRDVILTGAVNHWAAREAALAAAWAVPGVREVVDRLTLAL